MRPPACRLRYRIFRLRLDLGGIDRLAEVEPGLLAKPLHPRRFPRSRHGDGDDTPRRLQVKRPSSPTADASVC